MTIRNGFIAASIASGVFSSPVFAAQHQEHQAPPSQSQPSAETAQCAQAQPVIARTVDAAMARLEASRQANSPAQMRAAIDDLQGALRDIRAQLAGCAAMQATTGPHAGHTMPAAQQTPSPTPSTPAMTPRQTQPAPADHSKMGHAPDKPAAGAKSTAPARKSKPAEQSMDHSKMDMGGREAGAAEATLPVTPADRIVDPACPNIDTKTAPKATYQRKVYYFCSTKDRDEFVKDPAAYLKKRPRK